MKRGLMLVAGVCTAALHLGPAQAGSPLQTDDAGVLAAGECELEGTALRRSTAGERSTETSLQAGCGFGWNSQFAVALATARSQGVRESGLALGGKTGLWQGAGRDDEAAALALAWQVAGAKIPGESWRHAESGLNLIASLPVAADLTLHANLGHARSELDRQDTTTWGLGIEHAGFGAAQRWAPMAEVFGDDRERPSWNLGLRYAAVPDKVFVVVSYGRQFTSERPSVLKLGFKAAF